MGVAKDTGVKGSNLLYNEYIVYDVNQVRSMCRPLYGAVLSCAVLSCTTQHNEYIVYDVNQVVSS